MGRKKKEEIIEEFIPSKYQKNIFDFIEHGVGNLVVEAVAGSGKTSTIVQALKLIPIDKKILFCAFNKDIVKELTKKIGKQENVDVRTVHSLGLLMLQRNFKDKELSINENKYRQFVMTNLEDLSMLNFKQIKFKDRLRFIDNTCNLINYCRYNLADTEISANSLVERHGIELVGDEIIVALEALKWGKTVLDEIDYTDMIWMPNILYLKPIGLQYDFVAVDESQDLSTAQRELLLKCQKMGTRYMFLGDSSQCIYSFASADPESFNKLKEIPNTISLPLSISYRCPKNIVKFAQTLVPIIEANDNNKLDGEVLYNVKLEDIKDGDMVLCRNNAPLIKIYNDFIRMGRKCQIRGKDIGMNLKRFAKTAHKEELNPLLDKDGVFVRLYESLFETRDKMIKQTGLDKHSIMNSSIISNKLDMIRTLEVLSEGINTIDELNDRITKMFSDKKSDGIKLSTVHKAKGLEAENVYIACSSLMPSKSATKKWEIEQEKNLMYVAYTRSKNKLGFIDESDFKKFTDNSTDSLKRIEEKVNYVLNKKSLEITPQKYTSIPHIIPRKNVETMFVKTNSKVISDNKPSKEKSLLSMGKRKKTKLNRL